MSVLRAYSGISGALRACRAPRALPMVIRSLPSAHRRFHISPLLRGVKSQVLQDVGEGITEVQIIQWYVEEGAHIEEWKPLCQYQSDKAVDDITSRYEGVVKKLHFQTDDTVPTGKALCDIEVDDAKYPDEHAEPGSKEPIQSNPTPIGIQDTEPSEGTSPAPLVQGATPEGPQSRYATLATPAVRGLLKIHNVNITDVKGSGKDGRVLKEDVNKFIVARDSPAPAQPTTLTTPEMETTVDLTPIQAQMFKTMSRSLSIPHFLYGDELNINNVTTLRRKLASNPKDPRKVTFLSFVIKAVSLALNEYPLLNAKVDMSNPEKPRLIMRPKHNIGVAIDTPQGLIVPNIKDVANKSILEVAAELSRLAALGKEGKFSTADLSGGTLTVSNIGNIGGTHLMPVLVPTEVAILGIGKSRTMPVFDDAGQVIKGELVNFSWSADHRVVDGATMARMATKIREFIESPELMLLNLR